MLLGEGRAQSFFDEARERAFLSTSPGLSLQGVGQIDNTAHTDEHISEAWSRRRTSESAPSSTAHERLT